MGPFETHAERLLERGYSIIPIIPGTKKPGFFQHGIWVGLEAWTKRFNGRASLNRERKHWGLNGTGIGVLGGPASGDLVGIDIDTEDPQIVAALLDDPAADRGQEGRRAGRDLVLLRSRHRLDQLEHRRQADRRDPRRRAGRRVLPPTVHPDTRAHTVGWAQRHWRTSGRRSCRRCRPISRCGSPQFSSPFGYNAPPPRVNNKGDGSGDDGDTPHRQLNEAALANLDAWVPALQLYKVRRTAARL